MHVVVGRLLSVERRNIVGNVRADDVTDEEVRCTEALLRVLLPAWMSDLLIFGSLTPQGHIKPVQTQYALYFFY